MLCQEVLALLPKGAFERVPASEVGHGCYSSYFLVPIKDRVLCPIVEMHLLNFFQKKEKFKMLTLAQVLSALDLGNWMVNAGLAECLLPHSLAACSYWPMSIISSLCSPLTLPASPGVHQGDDGGCSISVEVRGSSLPLPRLPGVEGGLAPGSRLPPPGTGGPTAFAGVSL